MAKIKSKTGNADAFVKYKTKKRGGCLTFLFGFFAGIVFFVGSIAGVLFYAYNYITVNDFQNLIGLEMEWGDGADWESMTASDIVQFVLGVGSDENGLTLSEAEDVLGIIIPSEVNGVSTASVLNPLLEEYTEYSNYQDIPLMKLPNTLVTIVNEANVEDTIFIMSMFTDLPDPIVNISNSSSISDVVFTTFMANPESYIYDITMTEIANSLDIDLNNYQDGDIVAWVLDLNSAHTIGNLANDPDGFVNDMVNTIMAEETMQELNDVIDLTLDQNLLFKYVSGLTVDYISANITDVVNSITVEDLMNSGFGNISDALDTVDPALTIGEVASTQYLYDLTLQDLIDMGLFTAPASLPDLDTTISVDYVTSTDFTTLTLRDIDTKGLIDIDTGFLAKLDETLTVNDILSMDPNVLLNGILVSDIIETPEGGHTGIMAAVADFEVLKLATEIDTLTVADVIEMPEGGYTGVIAAVQSVTINNLAAAIDALTIGEILGGVQTDYSGSVLFNLYNLTITDIQDDATLQAAINDVTVGQTLGGVKDDYTGSIMYALYDIQVGSLQTEIETLTVGELFGQPQATYDGSLMYYMYNLTLADMKDPNSVAFNAAIDSIKLGDVLGGVEADYSGALKALYNTTLGNLEAEMDALTLDQLLDKDLSLETGILKAFNGVTLNNLETTINGLTMGDVVTYPATPTGVLAIVDSATLISDLDSVTIDLGSMTMLELKDIDPTLVVDPAYDTYTVQYIIDNLGLLPPMP